MPVMSKTHHARMKKALVERFDALLDAIEPRELESAREGAGGRRHWATPEAMCATKAPAMELRLVVEDFKAILAEVKKLK